MRPSRLAIERQADATNLDAFRRVGFLQLLLVDAVREVADEKTRTHCGVILLLRSRLAARPLHALAQLFAGLEGRHAAGSDLNRLARLWFSARTRRRLLVCVG